MMAAAVAPREHAQDEKLLRLDPCAGRWRDTRIGDLAVELAPGDLLVLNDAATIPASLAAVAPSGAAIEIRLLRRRKGGARGLGRSPVGREARDRGREARDWQAVLFGAGDWRTPTEHRVPPERVQPGDALSIAGTFRASVTGVSAISPRLVDLRFDREGDALWSAIYRYGRPVQYSYLHASLDLWSVQTKYGSRPWAVESPSAGRPLTWAVLQSLAARGIRFATLTHAAGLSNTGDPGIDAALPFPEQFEIPAATIAAISSTHAAGHRVIAVGTTVVRALEGSAANHRGTPAAGESETDLRIRPGYRLQVVGGLLTGLHEPTASHFDLLQAFAPLDLLRAAYSHAEEAGYVCHEFGDSNLILPAK